MNKLLVFLVLYGVIHVLCDNTFSVDELSDAEIDQFFDDEDESRQLRGPKERRQLLLKVQGEANEKRNIEHCWRMFYKCNTDSGYAPVAGFENKDHHPHCSCSLEFYICLQKVNTYLSNQIGELFFKANAVCYRSNFPVKECTEFNEEHQRCMQYLLDLTGIPTTQWFDLPYYFSDKELRAIRFLR